MDIHLTGGVGSGPTELSAFDHALVKTGIHNYNILTLSSVIPPNSTIHVSEEPVKPGGKWGDRLYVVMAQIRTSRRDEEVWAGIGWITNQETGKGLLVEHEGHSKNQVEHDIEHSLAALVMNRPGEFFGPVQMHISGGTCHDRPVCALVVAVFETQSWQTTKK